MTCFIRLDDACEKMNIPNWERMEALLDRYGIAPLVGIIPHCEDPDMADYPVDPLFWDETVPRWVEKGWVLALHGWNHVCTTREGGLNPAQKRSEFAGVPLETQKQKITDGVKVFREHGFEPAVFFAPSHTFDENTLEALKACSDIRIISDTIASKPYTRYGFTFIPLQSGVVRKLPFDTVTFCYHPSLMQEADFARLEAFLEENHSHFKSFEAKPSTSRRTLYDDLMRMLYHIKWSRR